MDVPIVFYEKATLVEEWELQQVIDLIWIAVGKLLLEHPARRDLGEAQLRLIGIRTRCKDQQ